MRTSTQLRAGAGAGWMPTSAPRRPMSQPGGSHDEPGQKRSRRRGHQDGSRWLTGRGPHVAREAALGTNARVRAGEGSAINPDG